jgi:hypothetical protein
MTLTRRVLVPAALAVAIAASATGVSTPAAAQQPPALRLPAPSPKAALEQTVGLTDIKMSYSRPGVKGRVIWGDLVPYGEVWRTGANAATTITFSTDVMVGGKPLTAGTYSLHTIPTTGDWTVIFNTKADQWGSYAYDEKDDAARITVKPMANPHTEWMQFSITELGAEKATLALDWEKIRVAIPIEVKTIDIALAGCREAMANLKADDYRTAYRCASFAFDNNVALDEGKAWLEKSIAIQPWWLNYRLKANWAAKEGKYADAIMAAEKAIEVGTPEGDMQGPKDELDKLTKSIAEWKTKS